MQANGSSALDQLLIIYESFAAAPKKKRKGDLPREVMVFVRMQEAKTVANQIETPSKSRVIVERKHAPRKFLIWLLGTSKQYEFENNMIHLATLIQNGFKELSEGTGDSKTLEKVAACFGYYQDLVRYYAAKHYKERGGVRTEKTTYPEVSSVINPTPPLALQNQRDLFIERHLYAPISEYETILQKMANPKDTSRETIVSEDKGQQLFAKHALLIVQEAKEKALDPRSLDTFRTFLLSGLFTFLKKAIQLKEFTGPSLLPQIKNLEKIIPKDSPLRGGYDAIEKAWTDLQDPKQSFSFSFSFDAILLKKQLKEIYDSILFSLSALELQLGEQLPHAEVPSEAVNSQRKELTSTLDRLEDTLKKRHPDLLDPPGESLTSTAVRAPLTPVGMPAESMSKNKPLEQDISKTPPESDIEELPSFEDIFTEVPEEPKHSVILRATVQSELETTAASSDLSGLFEKLKQVEVEAEAEAEEKPNVVPETKEQRPRAVYRTQTPQLSEKCESIKKIIETIIKEIEVHQDDLGVAEILRSARDQLLLKRTPKTELQELENLSLALVKIRDIVEFSPKQEKPQQLRLWTLHAISIALTSQKQNDAFFETITIFCNDAYRSLDSEEQKDGINISETLAKIDEILPALDRKEILGLIENGQSYYTAQATQALLSNPISISFDEPTRWHTVFLNFNERRLPIEQSLPAVLLKVQELQRIRESTQERVKKLEQSLENLKATYRNVQGLSKACDIVNTLKKMDTPQSIETVRDRETRVIHLETFVQNIREILFFKYSRQKDQEDLTDWVLFGIFSLNTAQLQNLTINPTHSSIALETFSKLALEKIMRSGQETLMSKGYDVLELVERLVSLNELLNSRGENTIPLPEFPTSYLPDFSTNTPLVNPLDWKAIERTWEEKRTQQKTAHMAFKVVLDTAESNSDRREQMRHSFQEISEKLKKPRYMQKFFEERDVSTIQKLIPTKEDLIRGPLDRLDRLLDMLNGIAECIDVLDPRNHALEYQQQVAKYTLKTLSESLQKSPLENPWEAKRLLWPSIKGPDEDSSMEEKVVEARSTQSKDFLETLCDLMNVDHMKPISEASQRNLSEEYASINSIKQFSTALFSPILAQKIAIPNQSHGEPIQKTGQELLEDIETIRRSSPRSLEELRQNRESMAAALSAISTVLDPRMLEIYEEKLLTVRTRLIEVQVRQQEDIEQLLTQCSDSLEEIQLPKPENPSLHYLEWLKKIQKLDELQTSLSEKSLHPHAEEEEARKADISRELSLNVLRKEYEQIVTDIAAFDTDYQQCSLILDQLSAAFREAYSGEETDETHVAIQEIIEEKNTALKNNPWKRIREFIPLSRELNTEGRITEAIKEFRIAKDDTVKLFQGMEMTIANVLAFLHINQLSTDTSKIESYLETLRNHPGITTTTPKTEEVD
jgi:hypothetical protein